VKIQQNSITKKIVIITFLTLFIMSSCRDLINPVDPESDLYIGYESKDDDGDGIGQYEDVDEIELVSPADGDIIRDFPLTLSTNPFNLDKITKFHVQVSTNIDFASNNIVFDNEKSDSNKYTISTKVTSSTEITISTDGFLNETQYYWRIKAYDGSKWSKNWSTIRSFTTSLIPQTPSDLAADSTSENDIVLNWVDNSDNEIGFKIERSATSETTGFLPIATLDANITSHPDTNLSLGTYWYRVRAYNSEGDSAWSSIAFETLSPEAVVSTPVFSPTGGPYTASVDVTISCTTSDSTIRYTTDGSTPSTTNGTIIASGSSVNISNSLTLKAIAYKTGLTTSSVSAYSYLINIPGTVETPTFSPAGGPYTAPVNVIISCSTSGATIRYTTDGSTPSTTHGTIIASGSSVNISNSLTLKSVAYKTGLTISSVFSYYYAINIPGTVETPAFSPSGGIFAGSQNVIISCLTSGATIRYTTDGSTPSETHGTIIASGASVSISASVTLKAIGYKTGSTKSSVASTTFTKLDITTGVSATDGTYTDRVRVSWNSVSGASRYYVYRSTSSSGTYSYLGYVTGLYRDDTTASPGATYYYEVRAYNDGHYSDYSSYNSGWSDLIPPTGVSASDGSYTDKVRIGDWSSVSGASRYYVYRATSSSGTYSSLGYTSSTYYYDTTATPGTNYYYKLKAYNDGHYSDLSSYNSGWRKVSAPSLVSPTSGSTTNDNTPYFDWGSVSGANGYEIEIGGIGFSTGFSYYTPASLDDGTYSWKVRALDSSNRYSDWSSLRSIKIDAIRRLRVTAEYIYINDDADLSGAGEITWYFGASGVIVGSDSPWNMNTPVSISSGTSYNFTNVPKTISVENQSGNYYYINLWITEWDGSVSHTTDVASITYYESSGWGIGVNKSIYASGDGDAPKGSMYFKIEEID